MNEKDPQSPKARRSFLARLGFGAGVLGAAAAASPAALAQVAAGTSWRPARHDQDDWLDKLPGRHRLVFDTITAEGIGWGLRFAGNYFTANVEAYGLSGRQTSAMTKETVSSPPWLRKKAKRGFRGYPVATLAFYGPTNDFATKLVVGIMHSDDGDPDPLERWFSEDIDIRRNPEIGEQVIAFLNEHNPKTIVMTDSLLGCPHEEGIDYPIGKSCPKCPYWAGRDRFTGDRIH